MEMNSSQQLLAKEYTNSYASAMQQQLRDAVQPVFSRKAASMLELLEQIAAASTPQQLNKRVNQFQSKIFNLSRDEQALLRERLAGVLSETALKADLRALRLEAAGWLRLLVQAAYLAQPGSVFSVLVTAATHNPDIDATECRAYLNMIVDCFWPFRHPYAAYTWEQLPANSTFLPLMKLFALNDDAIEDSLITMLLQLPALDDRTLIDQVLPVALLWAAHSDSEHRQRILPLLKRINSADTHSALEQLCLDQNPVVRANAQQAVEMAHGA